MSTGDSQDPSPDPDATVARRHLLRGGAALAGAAGLSVASAALATPAQADDGDPVLLGADNTSTSTTGVTIGAAGGSGEPALALTNNDGPSLYLNPLPGDWDGDLELGEIANTTEGPLIGVEVGGQTATTQLLTEQDVWLPFILPDPVRLVDTRTAAGRERITLPRPLNDSGQLPAKSVMTFWIAPAGAGFTIPGVYLNVTVVNPAASGWIVTYPGPTRPPTSTINFRAGQTTANSAFIGTQLGTYLVAPEDGDDPIEVDAFVVKIYTTATTHILVDGTGAFATGYNPIEAQGARRARSRRTSPAAKAQQAFGKL